MRRAHIVWIDVFDRLLFTGADELLKQLDDLWQRPRYYGRETVLPIIYLTVPANADSALPALKERLSETRTTPPHFAFIEVDREAAESPDEERSGRSGAGDGSGGQSRDSVGALLGEAVAQLASKRRHRRNLRFPHYVMATWLQRLRPIDSGEVKPDGIDRHIADRFDTLLRDRLPRVAGTPLEPDTVAGLPWWIQLGRTVMPVLILRLMGGVWRPPRWFAKQSPFRRQGATFIGLARQFSQHGQDPDEVDRLLVAAFLEDLRRAYRRTSVWGAGRRRTAYPILLLDTPRDAGQQRLIELIAKSREGRATGRGRRRGDAAPDPLLVIAAGASPPDGSPLATATTDRPAATGVALARWDDGLRRVGDLSRWFLRIGQPTQVADADKRAELKQKVAGIRLPKFRRPLGTYLGIAGLLLAGAAVPVFNYERCEPAWSWTIRSDMTREQHDDGTNECVGIVAADTQLPAELSHVVKKINSMNTKAESNPRHLTVVHLAVLTPTNEQGIGATGEELRGLAVAQQETLRNQNPIKILLANAGSGMKYALPAAEKIVARAAGDQRIVAVTGLGLSTKQTVAAVRRLGGAAMTMVGSATTADQLVSAAPSYFQVSPNNRREAQVAAAYAEDKHYQAVRIYFSGDPDDIYSRNLAEDMREEYEGKQIKVRQFESYDTSGDGIGTNIDLLGRSACKAATAKGARRELVVYAGRAERFNAFLNGMTLSCKNNYPQILASDDVSRFVLANQAKDYPGLKLDYMSLASSVLWGPDCEAASQQNGFYVAYNELFGEACNENRDGRALLTYDALAVIQRAVANVQQAGAPFPPPAGLIAGGIGEIRGVGGMVTGVSGDIDFGSATNPRVPADKAILILRATITSQPCLVATEGKFSFQDRTQKYCPRDPGR